MRARPLSGAAFMVLSLGYAAWIHHGVGPAPDVLPLPWWAPRGFLFESLSDTPLAGLLDNPRVGVWLLALPSFGLAAGVFWGTRSAWARSLAASSVVACLLFAFYGLSGGARLIWGFFGWRGSATLGAVALSVGGSAVAPWLARSWLRRGPVVRGILYAPFFLVVVALLRNTTGTDSSLPFSVSPWPAVAVFGLEVGAAALAAWFGGVALGLAGLTWLREPATGTSRGATAVVAGLAFPAAWIGAGGALGLLPFRVDAGRMVGAALVSAVAIAAVAAASRLQPRVLRRRARWVGTGALLVGIPLLVGEVWSRTDYTTTREERAGPILAALTSYYEREGLYPESLDALVEAGDLESIPEPKIGFSLLGHSSFVYQGFGVGYVLEFSAPRWVQCAYSPPWEEEDELDGAFGDETGAEELADGEEAGTSEGGDEAEETGGWTCPSKPPELW